MFSEKQFAPRPFGSITKETHAEHRTLYSGYVKNANTIAEKLPAYLQLGESDPFAPYFTGELRRRFSFEFNGMRNHEVYFALLEGSATGIDPSSALGKQLISQWHSIEAFTQTFITFAASTRGIGWAMLSWDPTAQVLLMHWVDEQHLGQLQGTIPIVALDLWEHAYVADYLPSGKKQYITDFMDALNWEEAAVRFATAQ